MCLTVNIHNLTIIQALYRSAVLPGADFWVVFLFVMNWIGLNCFGVVRIIKQTVYQMDCTCDWSINVYCSRALGYLKILEIPKGARHLLIQEFKGTPHILGKKKEEELLCQTWTSLAHHFMSNLFFHYFLLQRWRTRKQVTSSSMMKMNSQNLEWLSRRVWHGSTSTLWSRSPFRPQGHWNMEPCSWSVCQRKSNMLTFGLTRCYIRETTTCLCFRLSGPFPWWLQSDSVL